MTLKMVGMLASVCVAAIALGTSETFARSGGGGHGGMAVAPFVSPRAGAVRPPGAVRPFVHHRRGFNGGFWPGGVYGDGPYYGDAQANAGQPVSNDATYTYKYDVPWDWAHRYPAMVTPSDRPYVPSCSNEPVAVAGRGGGEHTVNVIRCY